eukprot:TRINITY_DN32771_c0_g1_i1.p1 TRINITY_DN32771_c0_g1~~TRINITY_DN32771_c0_g1_i1.p1  ORF type:complete len:525 (+),score=7.89 TRINITY_DN32771_c0_g1_i1:33-1607(+)
MRFKELPMDCVEEILTYLHVPLLRDLSPYLCAMTSCPLAVFNWNTLSHVLVGDPLPLTSFRGPPSTRGTRKPRPPLQKPEPKLSRLSRCFNCFKLSSSLDDAVPESPSSSSADTSPTLQPAEFILPTKKFLECMRSLSVHGEMDCIINPLNVFRMLLDLPSTTLVSLHMDFCSAVDLDDERLGKLLAKIPWNLTVLSLTLTGRQDLNRCKFARGLSSLNVLRSLSINMTHDHMSDDGVCRLAKHLKLPALHNLTLLLPMNELTNSGIEVLVKGIGSGCPQLSELVLGLNGNTDSGIFVQTKGLSSLRKLNVSLVSNKLTDEDVPPFLQGANVDTFVLNLECNSLTSTFTIADGIQSMKHLHTLDLNLGSNKVGSDALVKLCESFNKLESLALNFRNCELCDAGASGISKALLTSTTLTSLQLQLGSNSIGNRGAEGLAKLGHSQLQVLSISLIFNKVEDEGAQELLKLAQIPKVSLDLCHNQLGDAGVQALLGWFGAAATPPKLSLEGNGGWKRRWGEVDNPLY